MTKRSSDDWHGCPIRYSAAVLGDPWSLLILRDLMFNAARHYADFLTADEGISTNILAARLVALENEGLIEKRADPEHGKRYLYSLTEKGRDLLPALLELIRWAGTWDKRSEVSASFTKKIAKDRTAVAKTIVANLPPLKPGG